MGLAARVADSPEKFCPRVKYPKNAAHLFDAAAGSYAGPTFDQKAEIEQIARIP
jgi:hypothetical protein